MQPIDWSPDWGLILVASIPLVLALVVNYVQSHSPDEPDLKSSGGGNRPLIDL